MNEFLVEAGKYLGTALIFCLYLNGLDILKKKKGASSGIITFFIITTALILYVIYTGKHVGYENISSHILKKMFSNVGKKIIIVLKFIMALYCVLSLSVLKNVFKYAKFKPKTFLVFSLITSVPIIYSFSKYGVNHMYHVLEEAINQGMTFTYLMFLFFAFVIIIVVELWLASKFKYGDLVFLSLFTLGMYAIVYFLDVYGFSRVSSNFIVIIPVAIGLFMLSTIFFVLPYQDSARRKSFLCRGCSDESICSDRLNYFRCPKGYTF